MKVNAYSCSVARIRKLKQRRLIGEAGSQHGGSRQERSASLDGDHGDER